MYSYKEQKLKNKKNENVKNNETIQRLAHVATRPLNQVPPPAGQAAARDRNLGFGNLKLNHRHIIFNANQAGLPIGQDNIGFHAANGGLVGPGALFTENVAALGYTNRGVMSPTPANDGILVQAINQMNPPGRYNVITHNCQDWVSDVATEYNRLMNAMQQAGGAPPAGINLGHRAPVRV